MGRLVADREPMDEASLKALLSSEIQAAVNYDSAELSATRARAIQYYEGEMTDTPSLPGRSRVVSKDVSDTIGLMLPGVIRTFIASGRMVDFRPVGIEDEKFADLASDYCNYIFMKENQGYRILWDSSHDSLLQGNGIIKHWWDKSEVCNYEVMTGKTEEDLAIIVQDGGEIVAQTQGEPVITMQPNPQTGQSVPVPVPTFDVKVKREDKTGRLIVECIEPENFLMNSGARYIEEARFTAHRDVKTRSDLIEMGFDADVVNNLPAYRVFSTTQEAQARNPNSVFNDIGDESTREIELFECYAKVDIDGDGVAEMVRAYIAGSGGNGELLDWEEWEDDCPFSDIPCEPRPHRWDARSIADETMDVMRIKTVLLRQFIDNLYASAMPMREVEVDSVINPEMMMSPKFGGVILRKKGSPPSVPHEVPFFADKVLSGLEYLDQMVEKRTGVSRSTMALDPETLQNQTATASQLQHDAAYSQTELVARNMAELGWTRVFRQMLKLIVKHQTKPRIIRLKPKAEPVKIDPSVWNTDMDVTVNVGLGTGSRDRDMAMLQGVLGNQMGLMERYAASGFLDKAIDMLPQVVMTMRRIAESAGLQNADEYYPEITDEELQQMKQQAAEKAQQPDPKVQLEQQKIQAQAQSDQMTLQAQGQLKAAELQMHGQLEQQKSDAAVTREAAQLQADLQTKEADRQNALMIEAQRQQFEREKLAATMQLEREKMIEEARQKELDRQQARELEMAKIAASERAAERAAEQAITVAAMKPAPGENRPAG